MAYRFNPPPNWPASEPGWTPPPGWQPDPSWGPAPDGWNFWMPEADAPVADAPEADASESAASESAAPEPAAPAEQSGPVPEQSAGSSAPVYGQASPAPAYAQASPNPGGYGAPASGSAPWQGASIGSGTPQQPRGFVARFWWLGCILLLIIALVIGLIGFLVYRAIEGGSDPTPTAATTVTDLPSTGTPTDTPTETATETETASGSEMATVTPSVLPTVDPAAPEQAITSSDGTGVMKVSLQWQAADELEAEFGAVEPAQNGQYLVATIWARADEGTVDLNPFQFAVITPYGGAIDPATETYALKDAGLDINAPDSISAGQEYSIRVLYDIQRNPGLKLQYEPYSGEPSSWDVPG